MLESLENLIEPGIIALVVAVAAHLVTWVFFYGKLRADVANIKNELKDGKLHADVAHLKSDMVNVKDGLREVKTKTDKLATDFAELKGIFETYEKLKFLKPGSPLKLTENGDTLLSESGGRAYLKNNFSLLFEQFRDIKSAYDIQEKARQIIEAKKDSEEFDGMKDYLYEKGIDFSDLAAVMGVELRDMVLSKKDLAVKPLPDSQSLFQRSWPNCDKKIDNFY